MTKTAILTDAQLAREISRCEYCEEKPCREGCPCHCSPADFIMAAKTNELVEERLAQVVRS
jgi:NADPH-dependent glutamate synthase beta subunit-like oxidoreductase